MSDKIKIYVDGNIMEVPAGVSVAAAILGHDHSNDAFHHNSMDGSSRAPYCLMGVCFECMMEIDGEPNVQSCLTTVREGMKIKRQSQSEPFSFKMPKADSSDSMTGNTLGTKQDNELSTKQGNTQGNTTSNKVGNMPKNQGASND